MARPFSASDARQLTEEYGKVLNALQTVEGTVPGYREQIKAAADALIAKEVLAVLRDAPVEELNRSGRGFRVKALRAHGYNTIADLAAANVHSIASVYGISEDAAVSIRRIVDDMAAKAHPGIKLRLSTDNKTRESTILVTMISRFRRSERLGIACSNLLGEYRMPIEDAISALSVSGNGLKWIFLSREKKQDAIRAYQYLSDLKAGAFRNHVNAVFAEFDAVNTLPADEAWRDFEKQPILFFNILEEIVPGMLGNDDSVYGLPEDLAQEIQEEAFFPDGLTCALRRYQEWGVKYILHQERVLLGDEMGLGKTVQAIAAMVSLRNTGATHFVVVCPASVLTNWIREIRKMSKLNTIKIHGAGRSGALKQWVKTGGVAVTTYETTAYFKLPEDFMFSLLVVDEAHYIKNPEARRTVNTKELSMHTERLLLMTGTALENRVDEMVSLIRILRPQIASQIHGMESLSSAPRFRQIIAPVYYRRKREDVLTELPELIEAQEWCTLNATEEEVYEQAVLSKNFAAVRRVSWNVDDLKDSSKAQRMLELIEEAGSDGRKVIVFSFFLDTIRKISLMLGNRCTDPINGSVPPQRRQEILDEFEAAPAGAVLVAQIQSGGTGLNIQSASVVILCEPQFKPSTENQAISRAYRMGQTRNVLVYRLLCENTAEERLMEILETKQRTFNAFADQSVAAMETKEIDDKTFGNIIQAEIDRIKAKNGVQPQSGTNQP